MDRLTSAGAVSVKCCLNCSAILSHRWQIYCSQKCYEEHVARMASTRTHGVSPAWAKRGGKWRRT